MSDTNTIEQLKAQAYDCLAKLEVWQKRLQEANQAIANQQVSTKEEKETKDDTKKTQ